MLFIVLLLLIGHLSVPCPVKADQGGRADLYSDAGLSDCTLADTGPQIADVYVVHKIEGSSAAFDGAIGIMFRLAHSPGFTGTWLEDIIPAGMGAAGTSQSGISIGYSTCSYTYVVVLHARYQMQGTSSLCSFVEAVPRPSFSSIITSTCFFGDELRVDGGRLLVNADQSCPCEVPVGTESSTWGRIKAMYRVTFPPKTPPKHS
jgi:hypothetical protein